jgi:hypothetical protein
MIGYQLLVYESIMSDHRMSVIHVFKPGGALEFHVSSVTMEGTYNVGCGVYQARQTVLLNVNKQW